MNYWNQRMARTVHLWRPPILLGLALSLVACASPYVEPSGSETAALTIENATARNVLVHSFKVGEDCSGGKLVLGRSPLLAGSESVTVKVRPGQPFSFYVAQVRSNYACHVAGTFVPREGARYRARFWTDPDLSVDQAKCYIELRDADSGATEPTFRKRTWRLPFTEQGSFCSLER